MAVRKIALLTVGIMAGALAVAGCNKPSQPAAGSSHAHSHGEHSEGPEGGHLLELGNEEYHIEWLHDDEDGVLTFIVRDAAAKEEVPIEGDLVLEMEIAGDHGQSELLMKTATPVGRTEEKPKTARFEIADPITTTNVTKSEGVKSTVSVTINDKPYTAEIEHHDHGHSHSH